MQRQGARLAQEFSFTPQTFVLPKEYVNFSIRFHQDAQLEGEDRNIWIMKPIGKS